MMTPLVMLLIQVGLLRMGVITTEQTVLIGEYHMT